MMSELVFAIEEDIRSGEMTFPLIAIKHEVPEYVVTDVWNYMCETELEDE
jgi:hypothetical protein